MHRVRIKELKKKKAGQREGKERIRERKMCRTKTKKNRKTKQGIMRMYETRVDHKRRRKHKMRRRPAGGRADSVVYCNLNICVFSFETNVLCLSIEH